MTRRFFLSVMGVVLDAAAAAVLLVPGVSVLLDSRRHARSLGRHVRVAPLSALTAGKPHLAVVQAERSDGYVRHPPGPIGRVWLIRDDAEPAKVRCLQTICPHLGCGIEFRPDREAFICPCHASEFDKTGKQRFGPSPRDMDELVCRIQETDAGQAWVAVEYQDFRTGTAERVPI